MAMASGAYALFIDSPAGSGPSGVGKRTVPLPPLKVGAVKFTDVWLSLAYDDFGQGEPQATAHVHIIFDDPSMNVTNTFQIPIGRTAIAHIGGPALAASVRTEPVNGHLPAVTALVEYTTP
jgi:hypothetical protein